jgi:hypothetical protein
VCAYDRDMKAYLFSLVLIGGAWVSACLAAERASTPAHTPHGHGVANAPVGGHETTGAGASKNSAPTAPAAPGEHPGLEGHDNSVSTHAHGPRQPTDRNSHNDNPRSPGPIDTHITVNQGRSAVSNNTGPVRRQGAPVDKGRRANSQTGIHVPHSIPRPSVVPGPTRNAIGVAPPPNAGARIGLTPFSGTGGAKSPVTAARSSPYSAGIALPGGAPAARGPVPGISTGGVGRPIGMPGSASINGAGMARGAWRVGEIGGPAKNSGGINGSTVRPKRP